MTESEWRESARGFQLCHSDYTKGEGKKGKLQGQKERRLKLSR